MDQTTGTASAGTIEARSAEPRDSPGLRPADPGRMLTQGPPSLDPARPPSAGSRPADGLLGLLVSLCVHVGVLLLIGQATMLPSIVCKVSSVTCVFEGYPEGQRGRPGGPGPGSPVPRPVSMAVPSRSPANRLPPAPVPVRSPAVTSRPSPVPVASRSAPPRLPVEPQANRPVNKRKFTKETRRRRPLVVESDDAPALPKESAALSPSPAAPATATPHSFQSAPAISWPAGDGSTLPGTGGSARHGSGAGQGGQGKSDLRGSESGGGDAMSGYLQRIRSELERAKRYPEEARRRSITGKVRLSFRIAQDGSIEDAHTDGDADPALASAALALLTGRRLPSPPSGWEPAARIRISLNYRLE